MAAIPPPAAYSSDQPANSSSSGTGGNQDNIEEGGDCMSGENQPHPLYCFSYCSHAHNIQFTVEESSQEDHSILQQWQISVSIPYNGGL